MIVKRVCFGSDCFRPFAGISGVIGSIVLLLLRLLLEAMGRGRKEAVERRNREEGTMIAVEEKLVMF